MNTLIVILIYLLGCILAYGRLLGSFYKIEEEFIPFIEPDFTNHKEFIKTMPTLIIPVTFLSWFGFILGTIIYLSEGNYKYFLKYTINLKNHEQ